MFAIFLFFFLVKKEMIEFKKAGGVEKLKEVAKKDIETGTKVTKEMVTYDLPQTIKKIIKDLTPRKY
jgi:hypothetical protein